MDIFWNAHLSQRRSFLANNLPAETTRADSFLDVSILLIASKRNKDSLQNSLNTKTCDVTLGERKDV